MKARDWLLGIGLALLLSVDGWGCAPPKNWAPVSAYGAVSVLLLFGLAWITERHR